MHKIPPFIVIFPQSYLFRTVHAVALGLVVGLHVGMVMGVVGRIVGMHFVDRSVVVNVGFLIRSIWCTRRCSNHMNLLSIYGTISDYVFVFIPILWFFL